MVIPERYEHGDGRYAFILDFGHGKETPGKRSPQFENNYRLYEYMYVRNVGGWLIRYMLENNLSFFITAADKNDVPLSERVRKANEWALKMGQKTLFLSLHSNAHGDGIEWTPASGIECWTSPGETLSDKCAQVYLEKAKSLLPDWKIRTDYSDGDPDKEANFYVLKHTRMPAILCEMGFHTNKEQAQMMIKTIWQKAHANVLMETILEIERKRLLE